MNLSPSPARAEADRALRHALAHARQTGGYVLPPIKKLASTAGVSYVTMWKAVRELCCRGVVSAAPRRGIRITGLAEPEPSAETTTAPSSTRKTWRSLRSDIQADVLIGVYRPGTPLPDQKQLSERYGVCRRTMRKALSDLAERGLLQRHMRHFRLPAFPAQRHGSTVVLVTIGDTAGNMLVNSPRTHDLLRLLEHECSKLSLPLVTCAFSRESRTVHAPGTRGNLLSKPGAWEDALGVVVLTSAIPHEALRSLTASLCRFRKPVALLDEDSGFEPPRGLSGGRVFSMAGSGAAGQAVGRHLLLTGHRRIAYISPLHRTAYSRERLAAVQRVYSQAGMPGALSPFVNEEFSSPAEMLSETGQDAATIEPLLAASALARDSRLATMIGSVRSLQSQILFGQRREVLRRPTADLCAKALACPDITAWVAPTDTIALECLDCLERSGKRPGHDISVIGFDDSLEAFFRSLTSYNFNAYGVVQAMLAHILERGVSLARRPGRDRVEVKGFLTVRRSSGERRMG